MKRLIPLILIFCTLYTKAGVPGYQGLKFSVGYDLGFMHQYIIARRGIMPDLYHNLNIDYVVARGWSVGLRYGFMTVVTPPNKLAIPAAYTTSIEGNEGLDPNNYKGRYTQHTFTFTAKRFFMRRGYIAPVGRYILLGCYYQYAVDHSVTSEYKGTAYTATRFKGTAHIPGIVFGIGRNFIVANRMIIDFGGIINVPCFVPTAPGDRPVVVYRDVVFNNLLQLYVGIGVLAF
jgi:hypothetical protein